MSDYRGERDEPMQNAFADYVSSLENQSIITLVDIIGQQRLEIDVLKAEVKRLDGELFDYTYT